MTLIAAVDIWQILIKVALVGLGVLGGLLIAANNAKKAAKGEADREVEHWRQALLPVIDVTNEIGRQFRNDNVVKSVVRESLLCVSDTLERILREHVGPRVAPRTNALRDVYEHVGELRKLYKRAFTDETQREVQESAASLAKEAENLRNALK